MPTNFLDKIFGRLGNRMFQMAYLVGQLRRGEIPDWYLQDPKYFDDYRKEIQSLFGEGIGYNELVAIHVRRGDYVGNSFYVDLTLTQYYGRAMNEFPNEKFLIFSDDIDWCIKHFSSIKHLVSFSEIKPEEEDLKLMASCKGIIMANSSFSWWAAYLGDENKKVIYPKQWYSDGVERTKCLKEWICV